MKGRPVTLVLLLLFALPTFSNASGGGPDVIKSSRHDTSPPLSQLAHAFSLSNKPDTPSATARPTRPEITSQSTDPVAQALQSPLAGVTSGLNFDGQSAADNRAVLGFAFVPPDTNGAVGDTQFVQMVNVTVAVYSKDSGELQMGPAPIHTLWTGFGGPCENAGDGGDPIVLYDHIAGRWLISQLQYNSTFTANEQCVAISTTSDATGTYNRYEFDFGANFPDYPKFSVWPDAYYNTINVFPARGFAGAAACAFDRSAMLSGAPASVICFQQPPSVASLLPADLDGPAPPRGEPDFFMSLADSTHLNLFQFHVDFDTPGNSTFTGPTLIEVAPYSEICARSVTLACIPEPPPGEKVDGIGDRLMFRLAYRNFGDHESLVVNHTVKGGALAGVRWYEIRSPQTAPFVFQQGTVVDPDVNFWMGSIAMDKAGNIALGFSASSRNLFPSVYVVGRTPSDALGAMSGPMVLVEGTGAQFNSFRRWGDYSSMAIDPANDCAFWYTQEYYATTGSFNWSTRVGSFTFDSCKSKSK